MYVSLIWRDKQTWFFFHYIDKYFCNMAINTNLELRLSTLKELDSNDITWIEVVLIQNPKPLGSKTSMLLIHGICFQLEALGQFSWCLITLKTIGIWNNVHEFLHMKFQMATLHDENKELKLVELYLLL